MWKLWTFRLILSSDGFEIWIALRISKRRCAVDEWAHDRSHFWISSPTIYLKFLRSDWWYFGGRYGFGKNRASVRSHRGHVPCKGYQKSNGLNSIIKISNSIIKSSNSQHISIPNVSMSRLAIPHRFSVTASKLYANAQDFVSFEILLVVPGIFVLKQRLRSHVWVPTFSSWKNHCKEWAPSVNWSLPCELLFVLELIFRE